ncbi:MAG: hypothetical protein HY583_00740 [Candidatus Omnitrophica bacterium]|nr:hypothetical protein [Candidatus Omnitrophota bacterium]
MANQEPLAPELEQLIKQVKLKEPSKERMTDYLAGVNAKIDRGAPPTSFGFPQVAVILAVGLVMAGLAYFYWIRPSSVGADPRVRPQENGQAQGPAPTTPSLSIEEEMAVLEAFGEEYDSEIQDLLGDDETLEELAQLDEIEFFLPSKAF